ncbi:WXG100 family type VII secretion target [Actinoplanes sp. NPDC026619]|uniref:WXG100 family type VII secretion target n=1 Tax=Actinoplanes sp. NPDC026619 TaxID=3155798 RepID=UPI00340C9300
MASFNVNYGHMDGAADDLHAATTHIETLTGSVQERSHAYFSSNDGEVLDAYTAAHAKINEGLDSMRQAAANGRLKLEEAGNIYRKTDSSTAGLF